MPSIKNLDKYCKKKGKCINYNRAKIVNGYLANEAMTEKSDKTIANRMHRKHRKGRVF